MLAASAKASTSGVASWSSLAGGSGVSVVEQQTCDAAARFLFGNTIVLDSARRCRISTRPVRTLVLPSRKDKLGVASPQAVKVTRKLRPRNRTMLLARQARLSLAVRSRGGGRNGRSARKIQILRTPPELKHFAPLFTPHPFQLPPSATTLG